MKLGTTFDENILKTHKLDNTIDELINSHASFMEIAPDKRLIPQELLEELIKLRDQHGLRYHVHIPYFIDEAYDADFFKKETLLFKDFFETLQRLQDKSIMHITCHGAKYTEDKQVAKDQSYRFIDYGLNKIEQLRLNACLNIETLNHNHSPIFGESIGDFKGLMNDFQSNTLKITWDFAHARLGNYKSVDLVSELKDHINYVHIHGLKGNLCHLALHDKLEKFDQEFKLLKDNQLDIDINVEQTVSAMGSSYLPETIKDLEYLNTIL